MSAEDIAARERLWDDFLHHWPLERLERMTLAEYSTAGDGECFTYWMEARTDKLGSIWGGSAFKFGIYSRDPASDRSGQSQREHVRYSDNYGWYVKYGETPETAFEQVRAQVLKVARSARAGQLEDVEQADLGQAFKWKLAFLYQDRAAPQVLPIYRLEYLRKAAGSRSRNSLELQRALMRESAGRHVLAYSDELLSRIQTELHAKLTTEQVLAFLRESGQFALVKEPTGRMAGFRTSDGREIALALDNKKPTLYLEPGSWWDEVEALFSKVTHYSPEKTRSDSLEANAPRLYTGHPAIKLLVPDRVALEALCLAYAESAPHTVASGAPAMPETTVSKRPPLNQILFGPPGTGKTFQVVEEALRILSPDLFVSEVTSEHRENVLKPAFDKFVRDGRVVFTTFHQSFSYEDFVEGIRAEPASNGQLSYTVAPGVFKMICDQASRGLSTSEDPFDQALAVLQERINESEDGFLSMRTRKGKKFRVQYKGKDSFLAFPENSEANLTGYTSSIEYVRALYMQGDSPELYRTMYNAPYVRGMLTYLQEQCGLPTTPPDIRKESQPFVLIIDEINRGNVSRVFGELITLIEPSKRAGREEALEVTLPYSKQPFSVPSNVYLIGTMNTADRSLTSLDIALRRRFSFVEMPPQPKLLDGVEVGEVDIGKMLRAMNERIEVLLDRDHCLGHAYFMPLQEDRTLFRLAEIFRANILPLLQEYFFEDWQRIQWVLNDHRKSHESLRFLSEPKDDLEALFGDKAEVRATGRRWRINDEAFEQIGAYAEIISIPSKPN